jgi:hypothetical protein
MLGQPGCVLCGSLVPAGSPSPPTPTPLYDLRPGTLGPCCFQEDPTVGRLLESYKAAQLRPAFVISMPPDDFIAATMYTYAAGAPTGC